MTHDPKIIIDGELEIEVPAGITVLQSRMRDGGEEEIPRFCYHERLSIAGNCRMCLVEVKGGAEADRAPAPWACAVAPTRTAARRSSPTRRW